MSRRWSGGGYGGGYGGGWAPYVPVAERRAQGAREMRSLAGKGVEIQPVKGVSRRIAETFWGRAWCQHLEKFSDFANRLPRGRTYVRNGSVCHLAIDRGRVEAKVIGSTLYDVTVTIKPLPAARWTRVKKACAGQIASLIELLKGQISDRVMEVVTHTEEGLFPSPGEIELECSCPDWAGMCKHVAAVMYGVGARLDTRPELLFSLRGVDHAELVTAAATRDVVRKGAASINTISEDELADVFGIDMEPSMARGRGAARRTPGARSAEPVKPAKPSMTARLAKSAKSAKPSKATKPSQATKSSKATKPSKATKSSKATKPSKATKLSKATKPSKAAKPSKATKSSNAPNATKAHRATKATTPAAGVSS